MRRSASSSHFAIGKHFNLANDSVAAAMLPLSAAARPKGISANAQRIGILQRLGRSIQRICHVGMHARDAGFGRTRAHAARDGLIVSEGIAGTRIDSTDGEIVHGSRSCRGNSVRNSLGKRAQQNVDDTLRGFNISSRNRRRGPRVHNRAFRSNHLDGSHQSGCGRNVVRQQTTENIEARRVGDGLDCVYAAFDLRIASCEIDRDRDARSLRACPLTRNAQRHGYLHRRVADAVVIEKILCAIGAGRAPAAEMLRISSSEYSSSSCAARLARSIP